MKTDLTVIIVTYNRSDKLQKCLAAMSKSIQSSSLDVLVLVVDNGSSDAASVASICEESELERIQILRNEHNLGGSNGFYTGMKKFVDDKLSEWCLILDDDAYIDINNLDIFKRSYMEGEVRAVACSVHDSLGIDVLHRRKKYRAFHPRFDRAVSSESYCGPFEIDFFSYVGLFLHVNTLQVSGLTDRSLFLWYDDTEHSMRIAKQFRIVCDPRLSIFHDSTRHGLFSHREYFAIRNRLILIRRHSFKEFAFHALIRVILICLRKNSMLSQSARFRAVWDAIRWDSYDYDQQERLNLRFAKVK